jgi:ribosomal protein S6--L-glutamate ligase
MKIAILSRDIRLYSTRRIVEAAEVRGHEAIVLDHTKCYMALKQGQPSIHYKGKEIEKVDAVIPRIGASVTFYGTAIVRQFEMMNVFSANPSQAITRSRDKLRSMQLLAKAGLGMPITGFANHINDVDDLRNTPCTHDDFLKATSKINSSVSAADLKRYEEWMKEFGSV